MTSDIRREALRLLADVWELSPDVRLGQLLAHLGFLGEAHVQRGLGDIEDDELMAIIQLHKSELQARSGDDLIPSNQGIAPNVSVSGSPTTTGSTAPAGGGA